MPKKNLKNLRKVQTCQDCIHYFDTAEHDDGVTGEFCTKGNKAERPRCGSTLMNESFWDWETYTGKDGKVYTRHSEISDKEFSKRYNKWKTWAKRNEVPKNHICDDFKPNENANKVRYLHSWIE